MSRERRGLILGIVILTVLGAVPRLRDPELDPPPTLHSNYTDEGWWTQNAARKILLGHWTEAGDYNTVYMVPVASLAFHGAFRVRGVSLATARLVAGVAGALTIPVLAWALAGSLEAPVLLLSLLFLTTSAIHVAFCRMALLDALLILVMALFLGFLLRFLRGRPGGAIGLPVLLVLGLGVKANFILLVLAAAVFVLGVGVRAGGAPDPARPEYRRFLTGHGVLLGLLVLLAGAFAASRSDVLVVMMANILDKIPSLGQLLSGYVNILTYSQIGENEPLLVWAAWVAFFCGLQEIRAGGRPVLARSGAWTFCLLWFGMGVLFVGFFWYQPKRYHMIYFLPAILLGAQLCGRIWSGELDLMAGGPLRRGLYCAAPVVALPMARVWIQMRHSFEPGLEWPPERLLALLGHGLLLMVAYCALAAGVSARVQIRGIAMARVLMGGLVLAHLGLDLIQHIRYFTAAEPTVVRSLRDIAAVVKTSDPRPLVGGNMAHSLFVETGVPGVRLGVSTRSDRLLLTGRRVTHLLIRDEEPESYASLRSRVGDLLGPVEYLGSYDVAGWTLEPERWNLYVRRLPGQEEGHARPSRPDSPAGRGPDPGRSGR